MFVLPAQRQRQLIVEELLENQPRLRGAAKSVEQLEIFVLRREMRVEQRLAPRGEAIALADFFRKRVGHVAVEIAQHAVNDSPQHPRADAADRFVDRDDAPDFRRIAWSVVARADQLDLRVHHLDSAGPVRVHVGLAVHHQPLALFEPPFQIRAVKKSRVQRAGIVPHGHVKHSGAPARGSEPCFLRRWSLPPESCAPAREQFPRSA